MKKKTGIKSPQKSKPTLGDLVEAAHAAGMRVTQHLEPILRVEVSQRMESDLKAIVTTGLFGVSAEEAARRILEEWLWSNQERISNLFPHQMDALSGIEPLFRNKAAPGSRVSGRATSKRRPRNRAAETQS